MNLIPFRRRRASGRAALRASETVAEIAERAAREARAEAERLRSLVAEADARSYEWAARVTAEATRRADADRRMWEMADVLAGALLVLATSHEVVAERHTDDSVTVRLTLPGARPLLLALPPGAGRLLAPAVPTTVGLGPAERPADVADALATYAARHTTR